MSAPGFTDDGTGEYNYGNANDSVHFCAEPRAQSAPPQQTFVADDATMMASESILEDDTVGDMTVDDYDEPSQSQTLPIRVHFRFFPLFDHYLMNGIFQPLENRSKAEKYVFWANFSVLNSRPKYCNFAYIP